MKIVFSCHPTMGGSGIVATELATALAHRGHQVHMAACKRPFRLRGDSGVIFHQVSIPEYPLFMYPPHDLALASKLAEIVRKFDIDIIHAHYAIPHAITALLARQIVSPHDVRVVTTLHGTDITLVGSLAEFYELTRHAMLQSDGLTAVSEWLAAETVRRFELPAPPEVIHNFVDTERFSSNGRAAYPEPGEPFHLVHASNLRPVKRVADIVRVFAGVQAQLPARLTILGEGPEKGLAQELVAELELGSRVTFASTAEDVPAVMRSAHLNLLLSDHESFGLSALEALACGTPVAGSAAGGLPEVIEEGRTGLLCPVGEVACTVVKSVALLSARAEWEQMSRQAAVDVRERFRVERVVPHYEGLYERVLAGRRGSPPFLQGS